MHLVSRAVRPKEAWWSCTRGCRRWRGVAFSNTYSGAYCASSVAPLFSSIISATIIARVGHGPSHCISSKPRGMSAPLLRLQVPPPSPGERRADSCLEKQRENVVLLIVDEVSFIGRAFLHRTHCRSQQAKRAFSAERGLNPEKHHFGDISMILVGDFGQLEPIEDVSLCDDETTYATCPKPLWKLWGHAQAGRQLLQSFKEAIMLTRIHRSKDDLWWTESCLRLRDFEMSYDEDYLTWRHHDLDRGHFTAEQKNILKLRRCGFALAAKMWAPKMA